MCYKQKCKVVSRNLAHPVYAVVKCLLVHLYVTVMYCVKVAKYIVTL